MFDRCFINLLGNKAGICLWIDLIFIITLPNLDLVRILSLNWLFRLVIGIIIWIIVVNVSLEMISNLINRLKADLFGLKISLPMDQLLIVPVL